MGDFSIWHWIVLLLFFGFVFGGWRLGSALGKPAPRWAVVSWSLICAAVFAAIWASSADGLNVDGFGYAVGYSVPVLSPLTVLARLLWRAASWAGSRSTQHMDNRKASPTHGRGIEER